MIVVMLAASAAGRRLEARGTSIVDLASGERVQWECGSVSLYLMFLESIDDNRSWYGVDQRDMVPGGLDVQPVAAIVRAIKTTLSLNCVRLPVSLEAVLTDPKVRAGAVSANPELVGSTALGVLDVVVRSLEGLDVILDSHVGRADWCCDAADGDGLWYSADYSEADWLRGLRLLARRYPDASVELRNEIRPVLLPDGRLLEPTWGDGNLTTDWAAAAYRGGRVVADANPGALVIVGGLDFGLDLTGVKRHMLDLPNLVYSAHNYAWSCPSCDSFDEFAAKLNESWGFLRFENIAPVFLGEFGTPHSDPTSDDCRWWAWLTTYLTRYHPDISWAYWPIDGTQSPGRTRHRGHVETYGLLNSRWNAPANDAHLARVKALLSTDLLRPDDDHACFASPAVRPEL